MRVVKMRDERVRILHRQRQELHLCNLDSQNDTDTTQALSKGLIDEYRMMKTWSLFSKLGDKKEIESC